LDERLCVAKFLRDQPNIHRWNFRIALSVAIDAVLADKDQSIGEPIERDSQASAARASSSRSDRVRRDAVQKRPSA
jgi:hypothetical protein